MNEYFSKFCTGIIKATFIKNEHKVEKYLEYRKLVESNNRIEEKIKIEDEFLKQIGNITLSELDACILKNKLYLDPSLILYLKGNEIFDDAFLNGVVEDFVITPNIVENFEKNDFQSIKEAFFVLFNFILPLPTSEDILEVSRCYRFIIFKLTTLKGDINLTDEEKNLINVIEDRFSKEKILQQINNMLAESGLDPQPHNFLSRLDPNQQLLKTLQEEYGKNQ